MLFQEFLASPFVNPASRTLGAAGPREDAPAQGLRPEPRSEPQRATQATPHRVLLVEDERVTRKAMTLLLSASGYPTQSAGSAEEALRLVESGGVPPIAIVDLDLPGMNGLELIQRLEQVAPSVTPVLITAVGDDALNDALRGRRVRYMRKPVDFDALLMLLNRRESPSTSPPSQ